MPWEQTSPVSARKETPRRRLAGDPPGTVGGGADLILKHKARNKSQKLPRPRRLEVRTASPTSTRANSPRAPAQRPQGSTALAVL